MAYEGGHKVYDELSTTRFIWNLWVDGGKHRDQSVRTDESYNSSCRRPKRTKRVTLKVRLLAAAGASGRA